MSTCIACLKKPGVPLRNAVLVTPRYGGNAQASVRCGGERLSRRWLIIVCPLLLVLTIGILAQRHMKSVAHFVSGGRVGGPYLLAVAKGEMQAGAVAFVAARSLQTSGGT